MPVSRINRRNFDPILGGKVDGEHEVVIKLYGSNCHLCHALKPEFVDISDEYGDILFYAFNMEEGEGLEKKWGFEGVPSICYVRTGGSVPVYVLWKTRRNHTRKCGFILPVFASLSTTTELTMQEALTYDDVLLLPQYSDIRSRSEVDISTDLGSGLRTKSTNHFDPQWTQSSKTDMAQADRYSASQVQLQQSFTDTISRTPKIKPSWFTMQRKVNGAKNIGFAVGITGDFIMANRKVC